jgi:hypothetical protein
MSARLLRRIVCAGLLCLVPFPFSRAQLPAPRSRTTSPWNGSWKLDPARSSPAAREPGVPQVYRFQLGGGESPVVPIRWEIPELGEVVVGHTDGRPMAITRAHPSPGLTLSVKTAGTATLLYTVERNGKLSGGGRMMLVDNGRAWVDLTWPEDREDLASELVYVRQDKE